MNDESPKNVQREPLFVTEYRRKVALRKRRARKLFAFFYALSFRSLVFLYFPASLIVGISWTRLFDVHHANFSTPLIVLTYPVGILAGFIGTYFLFLLIGVLLAFPFAVVGGLLINIGKFLQSLVTNYEHMARAWRIFPSKSKTRKWRSHLIHKR